MKLKHDEALSNSAFNFNWRRYIMVGEGVEADKAQAMMWCREAALGGHASSVTLLEFMRTCDFCGTRNAARKLCNRCRTARYCDGECQAAHWHREADPHKGHCRRAAEASEDGTPPSGGA